MCTKTPLGFQSRKPRGVALYSRFGKLCKTLVQQGVDPCAGSGLCQKLVVHLEGGVVDLLAHGVAGVGGGSLLGFQRVSGGDGGLHIGVVGHDLLLESGVAGLGGGLILCGDGVAVAAVSQQVGEGVTGTVEGLRPILGVGVVAAPCVLIPDALGGLLVGTGDRSGRVLVDVCGVSGQHRVIGNEGVVNVVVESSPLGDGGVQVASRAHLEQMGLDVVGLADGLDLEEVEGVLHGELLGQLDVGVERDDLAVLVDVAHHIVVFGVVVLGESVNAVQIVQAGRHTGIELVVVGGVQVDDVSSCIAHEGASLLCHGDDVGGSNDVIGVVEVDLADGGHIGLHEDHAGRKLEGNVGVARHVLHKPGLILVGDEHAGTAGCTRVLVDGGQQFNAFAGGGSFAQHDSGDLGLFNAVVHIGVYVQGSLVAVQRLGSGNHDALLVGASLLIGGVLVGVVAVGTDALGIVVAAGGVAVAVVGEGVGEAVAAVVHFASGVVAGGADVEQLVVIVGAQILNAAEHSSAVLGEVAADVERRAGKGGRNHGKRHRTSNEGRSNFLLQRHDIDSSLVYCRRFVGKSNDTPAVRKMQEFS